MSIHANITLFQNRYTNHINLLTWCIFSKLIYVQVPRIIYYSHIDMKISNHLLFVYFLCKYHWLKEWKGVLFFSYDLFYKIICILRSRICFWASIVQINEFIIMGIVKMSIALLLILKDQEVKKKKRIKYRDCTTIIQYIFTVPFNLVKNVFLQKIFIFSSEKLNCGGY